jgi:hypothetical protein
VTAEPGAWIPTRRKQLDELLRRHHYRGWDPFDLSNAPLFGAMPQSWWLPHLALSKVGSRVAPGWVRRVLRVPRIEDPKIYACAYFGYRHWDSPESGRRAGEMIDRLAAIASRDPDGGVHWGYDYLWAIRSGEVNPRRASTIVPGSFAILALLDDLVATGSDRHRGLIAAALGYYATRHRRLGAAGEYLGYFSDPAANTHNANMLGCTALSVGGRVLDHDEWLQAAARAATTSVSAVSPDGYLPYMDHASGDWTDCFHHLYVIACTAALQRINPYVDRDLFGDAGSRLRNYLRTAFLRDDGLINYYPGRLYPIDPHNYAAAAIFAVLFGDGADLAPADAEPLLRHVDGLMWDAARGRYRFRRHRRVDSRLFLRWTQAWMFAALSIAYSHGESEQTATVQTRGVRALAVTPPDAPAA